jgi:signal transduction histidine kinase
MSVNDAVREIVLLLEAEAGQADVTVDLQLREGLAEAAADFLQVQQVIQHLVRNGLEAMATAPKDQRRLTITTGQTPAGDVEVAICDRGRGLEGSSEQLFEPFLTSKTNGLGLGLSISRTIIEAHGGRIWITPNATHGVTARFTLPASSPKGIP